MGMVWGFWQLLEPSSPSSMLLQWNSRVNFFLENWETASTALVSDPPHSPPAVWMKVGGDEGVAGEWSCFGGRSPGGSNLCPHGV